MDQFFVTSENSKSARFAFDCEEFCLAFEDGREDCEDCVGVEAEGAFEDGPEGCCGSDTDDVFADGPEDCEEVEDWAEEGDKFSVAAVEGYSFLILASPILQTEHNIFK